jgi:DNA-binding NarL/FixJ family response regulator
MVIDRIVVTERTLEEIRTTIRWKDGSPPTEIEIKLSPYVHREIARLVNAGWSNTTIARHLNERAMKTEKNREWNVNSVGLVRRHL